jgi:hypothetical protein
MSILQPIDAQRQAEMAAEMLGADPDTSLPSETASADYSDEMLNVADALYLPHGRPASRWEGSGEFAEIAERFGKNDLCFGTEGPDGITLETPVGPHPALVRLRTDERHPPLGSGLLATLELPFRDDEAAAIDTCAWLNFLQSVMWSDVPQLGAWRPEKAGDGLYSPASAFFIPNLLYGPGLATNAALWQVAHARWAKQQLWADLKDLTMAEILKNRF